MLAYALYVVFVGAFIAVAALGHVLLLTAMYPEYSGGLAVDHETSKTELAEKTPVTPPRVAA